MSGAGHWDIGWVLYIVAWELKMVTFPFLQASRITTHMWLHGYAGRMHGAGVGQSGGGTKGLTRRHGGGGDRLLTHLRSAPTSHSHTHRDV